MFSVNMLALRQSFRHLFTKHVRYLSKSVNVPGVPLPILGNEVLEHIEPIEDAVVLDMTFGMGGHTELILKSDPTVKVLALDRDPASHEIAVSLQDKYPERIVPLLGKFSDLPDLLEPLGYVQESIDIMLFHFGCSTLQMETAERGFSCILEGPIDMRMDGNENDDVITAHQVLQCGNEIDLKNIFKLYGGLKQGKKIAQKLLNLRYTSIPLQSTVDLQEVLVSHCELTNVEVRNAFRSLRYFVNNELNEINYGMLLAEWYLKQRGRLVTISEAYFDDLIVKSHVSGHHASCFVGELPMEHSSYTAPLESDDIVKNSCWRKINKHVIIPEGDRLMSQTNKLRALLKIGKVELEALRH